MPVNANWSRWTLASVSKHFSTISLPLYIEGQHRLANAPKDFIELRVDGPYFTEYTKGYWRLYIEVGILVQSTLDAKDYHRLHRNLGLVANKFVDIDAFKLGDDVLIDTQEWFACLSLIQDESKRERIQTNNFGIIEASTALMQGSVEGHYEAWIKE